ncbi:MAG: ABC transporter permease [FCB group bacterium]|nr:ABC transporter permease [FCB group bacterium]
MTLRDLITISLSNLWLMKLRAFLTISGVVIAIGAFVSMLSFGAGNQELIEKQFENLGLFTTMLVYPAEDEDGGDQQVPLNDAAVEALSQIPGVKLAYPFDDFNVTVAINDTQFTAEAQPLPKTASDTRLFSQFSAGRAFASDSAREVVVTNQFLEMAGIEDPDSIIGQPIIITVSLSSIDSAMAHLISDEDGTLRSRLSEIKLDSLRSGTYRQKLIRYELSDAIRRFTDGLMNSPQKISDTLTVTGVLKGRSGHRMRVRSVILPVSTARRFTSGGLPNDPIELFSAISAGDFLGTSDSPAEGEYPRVTLDLEPQVAHTAIRDTIQALGYRTFSYAEQFDEIRQMFLYFYLALGIVGFIALTTASLGIVNTMIMSIIERIKEIGVLKSLGADEREIRFLFLVESGVIGSIGSVAGIILGWLITRVASMVAVIIMERQGVDPVELFTLPLWLILVAFFFGLLASLGAGYYPASRAARVDPVQALRNE